MSSIFLSKRPLLKSPISRRSRNLSPFHVMDILSQAKELERQGKNVYHMEVGEPDFPTAQCIVNAGIEALKQHKTHYTPAIGLPELRDAVAEYYEKKYSVIINPRRIIITPGASGALQLAISCLLDAGDNVLLADPGYPCNKNIAEVLAVQAVTVPVSSDSSYQLSAELVAEHWNDKTRAAMVATPSNPTGTLLSKQQIKELYQQVEQKNGHLIIDEIYQGLVYEAEDYTALETVDDCFIINSFSKYFGMTGWRIGWMVVPEEYVDTIDRIAQNIFLAPATVSQYAALMALKQSTWQILDQRKDEFRRRRDFLVPALEQIGFTVTAEPQGAFYIYAGCEKFTDDSFKWIKQLLHEQGVALTPGVDFGTNKADTHCRFAYTLPLDRLQQAVDKIDEFTRR